MSFLLVTALGLDDCQSYCTEFGGDLVLQKSYVHAYIRSYFPVDGIDGTPSTGKWLRV